MILLSLLFHFFANGHYYTPNKKGLFPYELEVLIQSINWENLSQDKKNEYSKELGRIDYFAGFLNKDSFFFLSKTEIYKYFLRETPQVTFFSESPTYLTEKNINIFLTQENLLSFPTWFQEAIRQDLLKLINRTEFNTFLKNVARGLKLKPKFKSYKTRFDFLFPWFVFFKNRRASQINFDLQKFLLKALRHLNFTFETFSLASQGKKLKYPEIYQLKHLKVASQAKETIQSESFLESIERVIKQNKKRGLPQPVQDWRPALNDRAKERTPLPHPSRLKTPEYKPPSELPNPTDDW